MGYAALILQYRIQEQQAGGWKGLVQPSYEMRLAKLLSDQNYGFELF